MKIYRFNSENDLIKYLLDHKYISIKEIIFMDYIFFDRKNYDQDQFIKFLDENNIVNLVLTFKNNQFDFDHLLYFPNRFNSLISNSIK